MSAMKRRPADRQRARPTSSGSCSPQIRCPIVLMSEKSIQDESQEWWDYPKCLEDYDPVVVDGDAITKRMKELASDLFTDEDSVDVQIIERYGE